MLRSLLTQWRVFRAKARARRRIKRPPFETMLQLWTGLLAERGLPQTVRWVFHEDHARLNGAGFAFRLRPAAEADRIARFAYQSLDPKNPLIDPRYPIAIVAYAVTDDFVITGFQGDLFSADEDVSREDWNICFDAKENIRDSSDFRIVSDDAEWARLRAEEPHFLSELDYLVSVEALRRKFGYRD